MLEEDIEFYQLGGDPSLEDMETVALGAMKVRVSEKTVKYIDERRAMLEQLLDSGKVMYGINTGFGELASQKVSKENLKKLQVNLIRSHSCGVGRPLDDDQALALMFARANELAKGNSGIRSVVLLTLADMINKGVIPLIPCKGSVGASGDLAPSAHMTLTMIGEGQAHIYGEEGWKPSAEVMKKAGIATIELAEKEGLALINGTQAMKAVGGLALRQAVNVVGAAVTSLCMTLEAMKGTPVAFDDRIHQLKPHDGELLISSVVFNMLKGSGITGNPENYKRVQDPYCIRCMPQAMGPVADTVFNAVNVFETELRSVTDNPLIVDKEDGTNGVDVLSGGNFHGQYLSFASDFSAIAMTALGNMSERRIAQMISDFKILPPFLARNPGLESGFMIAHVTAAALCNENKVLSHPASSDSIPTSANKEDFVSMGMNAANKLREVVINVSRIIAVELLAAAEGIEYHAPLKTSPRIQVFLNRLRELAPAFRGDEVFADKINLVSAAVLSGVFNAFEEEEEGCECGDCSCGEGSCDCH